MQFVNKQILVIASSDERIAHIYDANIFIVMVSIVLWIVFDSVIHSDFLIMLNEGDEISFSVFVNGGTNDDIYFILYSPDGSKLVNGTVVAQHSDDFSAHSFFSINTHSPSIICYFLVTR